MDQLYTLVFTLRRIFGFFLPGFSWLLLWYGFAGRTLDLAKDAPLLENTVLLSLSVLTLSYLLGALNIQLTFRLAPLLGDGIDAVISRIRTAWIRAAVAFLERRFHVLSLTTLEDDRRSKCPLTPDEQTQLGSLADLNDICKLRLLHEAPALAREALEVEGDINFHAGMLLPCAALGVLLLEAGWVAFGWVVLLIACGLLLRFQHLRHHEIDVVYLGYRLLERHRNA